MTEYTSSHNLDAAMEKLIARHGLREIVNSMVRYCDEQAEDAGEHEATVEEMMEPNYEIGNWTAACAFLETVRDDGCLSGEVGEGYLTDEDADYYMGERAA